MFVLLEFMTGVDKGKRSIVPFEMLKNVDEGTYLAEGDDIIPEVVLVEWRDGAKKKKKRRSQVIRPMSSPLISSK